MIVLIVCIFKRMCLTTNIEVQRNRPRIWVPVARKPSTGQQLVSDLWSSTGQQLVSDLWS
ncbi:hypothetical protein DPMN_102481 [Dreissena polymorpha]|uniref:Uncharacterized protein n=1 Tax=Dreissena polymorpha TaxID=45954 RepID=A0A9D4LLG7_DREPO|nr:hypothetical protein DPMN_102481 [Dreissena polymorpha]